MLKVPKNWTAREKPAGSLRVDAFLVLVEFHNRFPKVALVTICYTLENIMQFRFHAKNLFTNNRSLKQNFEKSLM